MDKTRRYWMNTMLKIADPVLDTLAADHLKERMPIESKSPREDREKYTYLEAFSRTLVGMAPWLECTSLQGEEETLRIKYCDLSRKALNHAVNPNSKDYMNFSNGLQPVVDAAFLAHAILRAPNELWYKLEEHTRKNLIAAMKQTRVIKPCFCNWLLFSAMVEAFLYLAGEPDWDRMRIDYALKQHEQWYLGDGVYGDGNEFHFDYYNSYVIQPMLVDIIETVGGEEKEWLERKPDILKRASHYATIQEHFIAPDGTYPIIGRSCTYRFGAFQNLSQAVLQERLEDGISYEQVRCALTEVIRNIMAFDDNFDINGWLRVGVCGSQPDMGEGYISTGSLYLCTAVFLPLGLPPEHSFWVGEDKKWTSVKQWHGEKLSCEHSL